MFRLGIGKHQTNRHDHIHAMPGISHAKPTRPGRGQTVPETALSCHQGVWGQSPGMACVSQSCPGWAIGAVSRPVRTVLKAGGAARSLVPYAVRRPSGRQPHSPPSARHAQVGFAPLGLTLLGADWVAA